MNDSTAWLLVCFMLLALFMYDTSNPKMPEVEVYPEDSSLVISDRVKQNLDHVYSGMDKEFPFCLHGHRIEGGYKITELKVPEVVESTERSAQYLNGECRKRADFIGMVHNHGENLCTPSDTDIDQFAEAFSAKVELVTCQRSEGTQFFGIVKNAP